ncbi:MAG: NUDIX hydrolase [Candidatus Hinthialibacter sp.]
MIEFPTTIWGVDSVISFEATEHFPPPELTSIAGGFVFHNDNVVLANIPGRGWEIIGGRIDLGESPEDTFRRETMRQIGVTLSHVKMLGSIRIEHTGAEPPNCPYPFPVGYGVQFIGIVDELLSFNGSDESLGRSLISFEGFKEHYYDWNEFNEAIFNYACEIYKKWRKKLKI